MKFNLMLRRETARDELMWVSAREEREAARAETERDVESPERTTHRHTRRAESCHHVYSNSSEASQKVTISVHISTHFRDNFSCYSPQLLQKTADQL